MPKRLRPRAFEGNIEGLVPITAAQCRAARALIRCEQGWLAAESEVNSGALRHFEQETRKLTPEDNMALRLILERAGVIFVAEDGDGPGVRLRKLK
jgi:hypothetical protein